MQKQERLWDTKLLQRHFFPFYRFILKLSTETVNQNSAEVASSTGIRAKGQQRNTEFHCENNLHFFLWQYPLFVLPLYSMGLQCPSHIG